MTASSHGRHRMSVRSTRKLLRALDRLQPSSQDDEAAAEEIRYLLTEMAEAETPTDKIGIREWISADVRAVLEAHGLTGTIAEIGGSSNGLRTQLPEWDFEYLSLYPGEEEAMVVADITACPQIPDQSYDAVVSVNCFEHIDRPWRAAEEITRILRPGGVTYHIAPFSYFYHHAPIDYWRYTADALAAMFRDLEPIRTEFYGANRRRNNLGSPSNPVDRDGGPLFSPDGFGGWRENWYAVYAGRKTDGWREQRIEHERRQVVVDVCKALSTSGVAEDQLARAAVDVLARLRLSETGEIGRAAGGEGIDLDPDEVAVIWRDRGKLGIKPSFRRFALVAMTGRSPDH